MSEKQVSEQNNVLAQATILMVAGILVRIIGVLYRSPVTSIIGDEGNGYYSIAVNIYTMILLLASYSIPMAVSKIVSAKLALKEYKDAHKVFVAALLYVLIIGGLATAICYFGAGIFIPSSQSKAISVLRILAPVIFLSGFNGVLRGYFQAHGTMVPTSMSQIFEQIINAIFSIGAAIVFIKMFAGGDPEKIPVYGAMGSAFGIGAGVFASLIFMLVAYMNNRKYFSKRMKKDQTGVETPFPKLFASLFFLVTPVILSTFVYNISTTLDMTLFEDIMDFKGMTAVMAATLYGIFSGKVYVLINVPVALANSMSTAMIPAISSSHALRDYDTCNGHVKEAIQFTMLLSIPSAVGLFVMACPIMQVLFPQAATIRIAINVLRAASICVVFYALSTVSNGVLQGIGKVNVPLRNAAVALIIHIVILAGVLYCTDLQLYGMVIGMMVYSFLMCMFNSYSVRKFLGYKQEIKKTFLVPAISALIMGVACYLFYHGTYTILGLILGLFLPDRLIILVAMGIAVCFAVVVYFVLVLILKGVEEEELGNFPKGRTLVRLAKQLKLL